MDCKGCMYEGTDTMLCSIVKLGEAVNDLKKEIPVIRLFAKDKIECKHRVDGYLEKARKEVNGHG